MGAKKGDVIGMVLPNIPEFPLVFLGAAGVNVSVTTMNPTYRPEELAKQLENSGAKGSRKTWNIRMLRRDCKAIFFLWKFFVMYIVTAYILRGWGLIGPCTKKYPFLPLRLLKYIVTLSMFLQNVKQACDIYGKMEKIIIIGEEKAPGKEKLA